MYKKLITLASFCVVILKGEVHQTILNLSINEQVMKEDQMAFKEDYVELGNEYSTKDLEIYRRNNSTVVSDDQILIAYNNPNSHISIMRCAKSEEEQSIEFPNPLSDLIKQIGFRISMYNSTFNLKRNDMKDIDSHRCEGLNVRYNANQTETISQVVKEIEKQMNLNIPKLYSDFLESKAIQTLEKTPFEMVSVLDNEQNENKFFKLMMQTNGTKISKVKLGENYFDNPDNTISIFQHLYIEDEKVAYYKTGSNVTESKTVEFLQQRKDFKVGTSFQEMKGLYEKKLEGSGLHQKIKFKIEMTQKLRLEKILEQHKCYMMISDFVDENSYIDIEEFSPFIVNSQEVYPQPEQIAIYVENGYIDIEKPSSYSRQEIYEVIFQVTKESIAQPTIEIEYPIHFRYQKPGNVQYNDIFVHQDPKFYLKCGSEQQKIHERRMKLDIGSERPSEIIKTQIPVGQLKDENVVTYVTIAVTFIPFVYFMYLIMKKSKSLNNEKKPTPTEAKKND